MSKSHSKDKSSIPTDEDFARAEAHLAEQTRLCEHVRREVCHGFARRAPLRDVYLFPSPKADYDAYVFYETDSDVETCRGNGIEEQLKEAILAAFGAGKRDDQSDHPSVRFIFDSHEQVKRVCNGNYFKYLR